jgi:ketosteroid isomerase-like protein
MNMTLPKIIDDYIRASNAHDVEAIVACFSDEATVRDENETLHGKSAIKGWVIKTIENYSFQFEPLRIHQDENEAAVAVEVSGTFPGSPITLDYNFALRENKISSLSID